MRIVPKKLVPGDQIRVIAPSLSLKIISDDNTELAIKALEALGLTITFGKETQKIDKMSSSSIEARISDLQDAFSDSDVKGILTVIGGFNSNQLLKYIDYGLIQKNPKIFCGYSDITALQNAIYHKAGLVTYSGPHFSAFAMKKGLEYTLASFKETFFEPHRIRYCIPSENWSDDAWFLDQNNTVFYVNEGYWVIKEGKAKGCILGGNLSTFQLLHGTPYFPSLENSILFIEADSISEGIVDVAEFDRDLQSLIHQPGFEKVQGLVIGRFEKKFKMDFEALKFIIDSKKELSNIPVVANVDFGHTMPMFVFPIGGEAQVNVQSQQVTIELVEN